MTLEEMKRLRHELGLTYQQISQKSGIPVTTVQKIFSGTTKSPRYNTLHALEEALTKEESRQAGTDPNGPQSQASTRYPRASGNHSVFRESALAYGSKGATKKQGEYTLEDYYALPDDRRVELIDGVIYDMDAPRPVHQLLIGEIHARLRDCIRKHGMHCVPFVAATDVQLDCDNRTMLQPDIFVLCDLAKMHDRNIYGAPEFTIEILSPSTRAKDMNLKCEKYRRAGVKEYWIVDPDQKKIIVFLFGENPDVMLYGFRDTVPVSISEGKCAIRFDEIDDYISSLYHHQETETQAEE